MIEPQLVTLPHRVYCDSKRPSEYSDHDRKPTMSSHKSVWVISLTGP